MTKVVRFNPVAISTENLHSSLTTIYDRVVKRFKVSPFAVLRASTVNMVEFKDPMVGGSATGAFPTKFFYGAKSSFGSNFSFREVKPFTEFQPFIVRKIRVACFAFCIVMAVMIGVLFDPLTLVYVITVFALPTIFAFFRLNKFMNIFPLVALSAFADNWIFKLGSVRHTMILPESVSYTNRSGLRKALED